MMKGTGDSWMGWIIGVIKSIDSVLFIGRQDLGGAAWEEMLFSMMTLCALFTPGGGGGVQKTVVDLYMKYRKEGVK